MDDQRVGTLVRQLRIRRRLRQEDLARLAGVSRATISRAERGHFDELSLATIRRIAAVLDVRIELLARWRAGDLDRLLNARHSQLHEQVARRMAASAGWATAPEASFAIRGERGVIDLLAFHRARNMVLVIELKTEIVDVNELLGTLDRKRRLATSVAAERGWPLDRATPVSTWLIVADSAMNRSRVEAHRAMLRSAYPVDGRTMPGWLVRPNRQVRALSFWANDRPGNGKGGLTATRRVRRPNSAVAERGGRSACDRRGLEP